MNNQEQEVDHELIKSAEEAMRVEIISVPENELVRAFGTDKRWLVWKKLEVDGRMTKVPYSVLTGRRASSTNEADWVEYPSTKSVSGSYAGVGIVFTPDERVLGIDLDHILKNGIIEHDQKAEIEILLEKADTYTEVSPSGDGLHLILRVDEPLTLERNRKAPYEAYTSGRFFTVTAKPYGLQKPVRTVSKAEALQILKTIGYPWNKRDDAATLQIHPNTPTTPIGSFENEDVLEKMFASQRGNDVRSLYQGDTSKYGGDESAADMALCAHLAFWTGKNAAQMEHLWLASGLGTREKTQKRKDYRDRTIAAAIQGCTNTYSGTLRESALTSNERGADESNSARYRAALAAIPKNASYDTAVTSLASLLEDLVSTASLTEGQMFIQGAVKDYFGWPGTKTDLVIKLFKELYAKKPEEESQLPPRERIAKCPMPEKPVTFAEWKKTITDNFPDLRFAAEVSLSVIAQLLVKDIANPFALVLVDVPSSGKTITINFFDGIPELSYATDKFTVASFVSNAANVSPEELAQIDLLPRLQYRMFLIRDLATLFSKRSDDLNEALGLLTRVLDGEGLSTDSGVHGQRHYTGEYLFMILAASTPIPHHVMKLMGTLGSRLFFLKMNSRTKSKEELASQIVDQTYKEKEKLCRATTRDFLYTLWNQYPEGFDWNRKDEDTELLEVIARCAKLLAHLRAVIQVWDDDWNSDYEYSSPTTEKPDRLNQLFYNLARGHAIVSGRTQISHADLPAIIELCVDGAPTNRATLFRHLIEAGGTMTTSDVAEQLTVSKATAGKEMKTLEILGVCTRIERTKEEHEITLSEDFQWFLSDECRAIRAIDGNHGR